MVEIPLTQDRLALVDDVDGEWALGSRWCVSGKGYAARAPRLGVCIYMHREIAVRCGLLESLTDERMLDHRNRDKFDNRRSNLRIADFSLNNANRRPYTASGFQGVYRQHSRTDVLSELWMYEARWRGGRIRGWGYCSPEEAAEARAEAIAERWPERAEACV